MNLRKDHYIISVLWHFLNTISTLCAYVGRSSSWSSTKHSTLYFLTLCLKNIMNKQFKNNFQQRISWLSHRWRTQRNAISNVNCRIRESSNLWTHIALFGIPKSMLVWVSVNTSKLLDFFSKSFGLEQSQHQSFWDRWRVAWNAGAAGHSPELKAYSFSPVKRIITFAAANIKGVWPYWLTDAGFHKGRQRFLLNLTSNQVRLPAELKHINKRRKRN